MIRSFVRLLAGAAVLSVGFGMFVVKLTAAEEAAGPETPPPANQTFIGAKRCSSCHFKEQVKWKASGHSKAFELLPDKYQKDQTCLKCHTTGLGEASGFKDKASTPDLAGVTCEICHGPGSEHEKICKPLLNVKELSAEQTKAAKDSIWLMTPKNVCVECHAIQAHKESPTPKELRKKK